MKLGGRTVHGSSTSVQAPRVVGFAASSLGLLCPRWDCWACRILCDFQVLALPPISKCTWPCHRCRLRHATVGCGMPLRCQGGGLLYCCPAPQVAVRQSSHWQCSLCCILPRCVPTSLKRGGAQRRRLLGDVASSLLPPRWACRGGGSGCGVHEVAALDTHWRSYWGGCYESFDLSKTHSLSTQDLVKIFIHSFIHEDDHRRKFLKTENSF